MGSRPYILEQIEPVVHQQDLAVDDITIAHNKVKYPNVIVLDSTEQEISLAISYPDLNHIRLQSNIPITFTAYIY